jgi:putative endonuclease
VASDPAAGSRRRRLGQQGEAIAVAELQRRGYVILARNWRCPAGEIDIVARQGLTLVFVEARARRSRRFGTPEESITARKQARLVAAAQTYLQQAGDPETAWRIDVVAIEIGARGEVERLNLIQGAVG